MRPPVLRTALACPQWTELGLVSRLEIDGVPPIVLSRLAMHMGSLQAARREICNAEPIVRA
jgi:hypothetical protein